MDSDMVTGVGRKDCFDKYLDKAAIVHELIMYSKKCQAAKLASDMVTGTLDNEQDYDGMANLRIYLLVSEFMYGTGSQPYKMALDISSEATNLHKFMYGW